MWKGSTFVDFEHGLNAAINRLRRTLGDSADQPQYIETLPGRGYRFISQVQFVITEAAIPVTVAESPPLSNETVFPATVSLSPTPLRKRFSTVLRVLAFIVPALLASGFWLQHWMQQKVEFSRLEMQGDFFLTRWTEAEIRKGIESYNRAIVLDPASASAYQGLSAGWSFLSDLYSQPREVMPKAKAAALKAASLDRSSASAPAHVALGVAKMQYDWDWDGAEREFRRAIELSPADDLGHRLYGWLLIAGGRFKQAQEEIRRPLETDPLNDFNLMELGLAHYFARQYDPAIEQCHRAIAIDGTSYWHHMVLGWALEQQGKFPAALDALTQANRLNDNTQTTASLAHAYAVSGRRANAEKIIAELHERSGRTYVSPYDMATIYAGLGDKEQTFVWLEKAYEDRSGWLALWVKVDPKFDIVRSDPRFRNLLRRVGFTD